MSSGFPRAAAPYIPYVVPGQALPRAHGWSPRPGHVSTAAPMPHPEPVGTLSCLICLVANLIPCPIPLLVWPGECREVRATAPDECVAHGFATGEWRHPSPSPRGCPLGRGRWPAAIHRSMAAEDGLRCTGGWSSPGGLPTGPAYMPVQARPPLGVHMALPLRGAVIMASLRHGFHALPPLGCRKKRQLKQQK